MTRPSSVVYNDTLTVLYEPHLEGGGLTFGQDVIRFVADTIGPVDQAMEWCAGPGFIGVSLLAHGLCRRLVLCDVNPEAVRIAKETVRVNGLADRVAVYQSDCLDGVEVVDGLDLVVGNPPHTPGGQDFPRWGPPILYKDPGWRLHRRFYQRVGELLSPGGSVVIQENGRFSQLADFEDMIRAGGLELVRTARSVDRYYFIWSRKPGTEAAAAC